MSTKSVILILKAQLKTVMLLKERRVEMENKCISIDKQIASLTSQKKICEEEVEMAKEAIESYGWIENKISKA